MVCASPEYRRDEARSRAGDGAERAKESSQIMRPMSSAVDLSNTGYESAVFKVTGSVLGIRLEHCSLLAPTPASHAF
jgi:hypothetical protein